VAIERATCPECRTTLKSTKPTGFVLGEALECPKCGTYFAAEATATAKPVVKPRAIEDDDEDERPRKKKARVVEDDEDEDEPPRKKGKKAKKHDGERSYKSSPIRFIVLGVLVVIMLVLAFFLYQKWQREKEANAAIAQAVPIAV
jgi:DNA-directed RNA polymerase subunit M/transcription elongation factor TFIIS